MIIYLELKIMDHDPMTLFFTSQNIFYLKKILVKILKVLNNEVNKLIDVHFTN